MIAVYPIQECSIDEALLYTPVRAYYNMPTKTPVELEIILASKLKYTIV